jgi:hypothetical protein
MLGGDANGHRTRIGAFISAITDDRADFTAELMPGTDWRAQFVVVSLT